MARSGGSYVRDDNGNERLISRTNENPAEPRPAPLEPADPEPAEAGDDDALHSEE